jgi:hypothetical protein
LVPRYDDAGPGRAEDEFSGPAQEEVPVRRALTHNVQGAPTHNVQGALTHNVRSAPWRRVALLVAVASMASGCGLAHLSDLNFRVDNRLHFLTPKARTLVHQPITVAWKIGDFTVAAPGSAPPTRDAGYFAVFLDRAPIKPGQTLKAIASGDPTCERDPKCPDKTYLSDHKVFTTTQTHLRIGLITDIPGDHETVQMHSVTVVLLDTAGHRIGESAWELDFRMHRVSTV